jgi:hypothetical protein
VAGAGLATRRCHRSLRHHAAEGGWDVTSFAIQGERGGSEHALVAQRRTRTTGSLITYAPFAINQEFFERFTRHARRQRHRRADES